MQNIQYYLHIYICVCDLFIAYNAYSGPFELRETRDLWVSKAGPALLGRSQPHTSPFAICISAFPGAAGSVSA